MSWQNPKIDWTPQDGVRNSDFNRIEGNILELYNSSMQTDRVLYVSPTGNDSSGTGTTAAPYRTISKALSVLPKNLNGKSVMVSIAGGTYSESVEIIGFDGPITLTGSSGSTVNLNGLRVDGCCVTLSNVTLAVSSAVFVVNDAALIGGGSLRITGGTNGLTVSYGSTLSLNGVSCSNASGYGIMVDLSSRFYCSTLAGSDNAAGMMCRGGSTAAYGSSNLAARGAVYTTSGGGRIYTDAQYSLPEF